MNRRSLRRSAKNDRRRGFTLLEILLVLAVVAVIIGATWPSLMQYVREEGLRSAVDEVRQDLAGTRLKAIENGLVYQFRYEPGGRNYIVLPYDRPETGNVAASSTQSQFRPTRPQGVPTVMGKLPETLQFRALPTQRVETIPTEWLSMLSQRESLGMVQWSGPILAFLDGTTDNATLIIEDRQGYWQGLTLRGITGSVELGPVIRGGSP
ncbi:MAG: prepilin-type N-terminal cleavage/methylation domain-containing protein [Planctomyces sp.]|nr:prepilin-type N-terminal cleavage/methylation domain-containing protein [Planctomyces sp.]